MNNVIKKGKLAPRYSKAQGYTFTIYDEIWVLDKDVKLKTGNFDFISNKNEKISFIETLAYFAENYSSKYVANLYYRVKDYFLFCKGNNALTTEQLINFKSTLSSEHSWYLSIIKIFFKKWHGLGYSGVTEEMIYLLNSWRIKGNIKGDNIKRRDPNEGPLTDIELQGFNDKVTQAYELGNINKTELAISLVMSHTGRRPLQISLLKTKDLITTSNKKGEDIHFLNIPRIKQRNSEFREDLKMFAIKEDLWKLLHSLIEDNIKTYKEKTPFELNNFILDNLPLFPCWKTVLTEKNEIEFKSNISFDKYHIKAINIYSIINSMTKKCNIFSERNGKILKLTPRRFRYTIGTRAAREGFGELIIAELLDHSDTQNAGIYVKNVPEHVAKLDEAVGYQLAPFAQAFAGKLVDKESDSVRGNDATSRIRSEEGKSIGNCGDHGFCGANVPIPCYTCIHFQPWVDGPHKEVYDSLLEERKRVEQITGDIAIVEILDRSILAVAEVVLKCEKRVKELSELENNVKGI
ncbi:recombinase [Pectobacterium brasiliense]|uniref:site-specific integrase n=1 Tax=Pectobacterium brasiliense TaxID=180957 RepID=UPI000AB3645B|nr:site-specific integrase [Pectobacterium brasiliense]MCG5049412.1 recombinase [Pectobacterium brasiliense]